MKIFCFVIVALQFRVTFSIAVLILNQNKYSKTNKTKLFKNLKEQNYSLNKLKCFAGEADRKRNKNEFVA